MDSEICQKLGNQIRMLIKCYLYNSLNESLSISCGGILISIFLRNPLNISVHDHAEFLWDDTLTIAINKALVDDIASEYIITRQLIKKVNNTSMSKHKIHVDFQFKHLSLMAHISVFGPLYQ